MPRGIEYRIPLSEVIQAAAEHEAGWSLRALCRMRYERWGYKSEGSALEAIRKALRLIDAPVRDRIEATVDVSTIHGNAARAATKPGHPDHARYLAHRRARRAAA